MLTWPCSRKNAVGRKSLGSSEFQGSANDSRDSVVPGLDATSSEVRECRHAGAAGRLSAERGCLQSLMGTREARRELNAPDESDGATEEDSVENVGVPTAESGRGGKVNVVDVDPTEPVDPREEERVVAARKGPRSREVRVR